MNFPLAFIQNLGWMELLVIGAIILLVFGPRRLPEIAEAFGKSIRKFKSATNDVQNEVNREINSEKQDDDDK